MNDPFALDLTIILLLLGVGAAMVAGNIAALLKSNKEVLKFSLQEQFF